MPQQDNCCRVCSRGLYSCQWKHPRNNNERRHVCCWFSVVALVSLVSLCWMYICLVTFNDQDEVNWKGFTKLNLWVNWFMVLIIISAVLTSYSVLLLLFALVQVVLREPLNLHCVHKVLINLGFIFIVFGVTGISWTWQHEWLTVTLSLRATGPFLQFGALGAITLLSPFIFKGYHAARNKCSKFFIVVVFLGVCTAIFLCPLYIKNQCPCLIDPSELPEKPNVYAHRGASMVAPENTMMSFERSIECGVTAFETDVQLSKDRIPFLMHDFDSGFLRRTTDVEKKFPDKIYNQSSDFTWTELQSLNAGEWFLETDPFRSVWNLSEGEKKNASNQSIPSLRDLLDLAKSNNISVIFDLYSPDKEDDTEDVVDVILDSGIDPSLIFWLPSKKREYVKKTAPRFKQVYNNSEMLKNNNGTYLNVKYNLSLEELRKQRKMDVKVNLWVVNERWLFSLLWCAGASSVTTNSCHLLKEMEKPDLVMAPQTYLIIWIMLDIVSALIMMGILICYRRTPALCHRIGNNRDQTPTCNEKEQFALLDGELCKTPADDSSVP